MIPINIIFKVIQNNFDDKSIIVKMCRENSPKPIDDYPSIRISYDKLDFSSMYNLQESIRTIATHRSLMHLLNEPILPENNSDIEIDTLDLDDIIDKIVKIPYNEEGKMQEVIL